MFSNVVAKSSEIVGFSLKSLRENNRRDLWIRFWNHVWYHNWVQFEVILMGFARNGNQRLLVYEHLAGGDVLLPKARISRQFGVSKRACGLQNHKRIVSSTRNAAPHHSLSGLFIKVAGF